MLGAGLWMRSRSEQPADHRGSWFRGYVVGAQWKVQAVWILGETPRLWDTSASLPESPGPLGVPSSLSGCRTAVGGCPFLSPLPPPWQWDLVRLCRHTDVLYLVEPCPSEKSQPLADGQAWPFLVTLVQLGPSYASQTPLHGWWFPKSIPHPRRGSSDGFYTLIPHNCWLLCERLTVLQRRAQNLPWHFKDPRPRTGLREEKRWSSSLVLYRACVTMTHQAFSAAVRGAGEGDTAPHPRGSPASRPEAHYWWPNSWDPATCGYSLYNSDGSAEQFISINKARRWTWGGKKHNGPPTSHHTHKIYLLWGY